MLIEEDDQQLFTIIYLGNSLEKSKTNVQLNNRFEKIDQFEEYLIDKRDCSIIVILSNNIRIESLSPIDSPQICAIYDERLLCLYCLPTMNSLVDKYVEENVKEKERSKGLCPSYILFLVLKHWFFIGLAVFIVLAYLFPNVGKTGGYIRSEWSIKWGCIMLVFFINGLSIETKELAKEFLHIRLHIFIQIYSLLIIPFMIYAFGLILMKLSMNEMLIIGLIIMGSTSTTISSNVIMTKNAMGNECAALLNAIIGNLLGIFLSPALIFYFIQNPIFHFLSDRNGKEKSLDYKSVIKELSLLVLVPLFLGQIIHTLWRKQVRYIRNQFHLSQLNNLALLAVIWSVFSTSFANKIFQRIKNEDLLILIFVNIGIYLTFSFLSLIIARLPFRYWQFSKEDTVAIMFCGTMKSMGMGISLINVVFENRNEEMTGLLLLPFISYHVQQLIIAAFQVEILKKWIQNEIRKETPKKMNDRNIQTNLQITETELEDLKC